MTPSWIGTQALFVLLGLRAFCLFGILALPVWAPADAVGQVPLPEFSGPELRLAGEDPLEDRLRSLVERTKKKIEERRAVAEVAKAEAELRRPAEDQESPEPPSNELLLAIDRELRELERARTWGSDGLALLEVEVPDKIPSSFGELVEAAGEMEQKSRLVEQREARSRRLAALGAIPRARTATTGAGARLAEQAAHEQAAEALATLAEALKTHAELRVARAQVAARRRGLSVAQEEAELAQRRLDEARAEQTQAAARLERARARLTRDLVAGGDQPGASLRRRAARTRLEIAVRNVANAGARALRAQVELSALQGLSRGDRPTYPPEVAPDALAAQVAATVEARVEAETRLAEVRSDLRDNPERAKLRYLVRIRDGLEDVLASLAEERDALRSSQELQDLLDQDLTSTARGEEAWMQSILLTLLVLLIAAALLLRGGALLQGLDARLGANAISSEDGPRRQWRGRLVTFLALVFPIAVVIGAASILAWPVWQVKLTAGEAWAEVDRPLFYVDEQPISALSLVQLGGTVWLSLVVSQLIRRFVLERVFRHLSVNVAFATTLNTFVHYSLLVVGLSIGLRFVGVGLSSLAVLAGVLGIGIGFGLRNVTENFISGLIVLVERPIKVGDWIEVEGAVEGQVKSIRARSTTIRTRDNISVIIPNSEFVGRQVTNWSHGDPRVRLRILVGVAYGSDTALVRRTLIRVAEEHWKVLRLPLPEVQLVDFGSSALDFLLLVWVDEQQDRFRIESDLRFAIDTAFKREGIVIAFPQLDVHVKSWEPGAAPALSGRNSRWDDALLRARRRGISR